MWSIILGAVVIFVFGAIWFTFLFGKTWARLMDFNPAGDEQARQMGMVKPLIMNFILNLLVAFVVNSLFPQFLALSFVEYLKIILFVWLGFSFPVYATAAVWERKSWKLVLINSAQSAIAFCLLAGVIYFTQ